MGKKKPKTVESTQKNSNENEKVDEATVSQEQGECSTAETSQNIVDSSKIITYDFVTKKFMKPLFL